MGVSTTLTILSSLAIAAVACFGACDLDLAPHWSPPAGVSEVNPWPGATCRDICDFSGDVCLQDACGEATILTWDLEENPNVTPGTPIAADCDEPLMDVVGDDAGGGAWVACCCSG